jgi:hypothetical protein
MIFKAHAKKIMIYGGTIMPFKGNGYYNQYSELCRNTVNQWIRTKGNYDGCIDFDMVMRDPQDTTRLVSSYQNDGLHPDAAGHKKMGESIDLNLFVEGLSTGVNEKSGYRSNTFSLSQNYPNPFNPSTEIAFNLAEQSFVTLKVYDILGREVAFLVNEEKPAGIYRINFNASELGCGIYFYQLKAGIFSETKKMTLVK